ncbi:MAG: adenylyltransferase/cytidyltransferase family protein [Patescibacteria group bacterium]|nr:FAD synthase [Patescibacteria group bacterium]
MKKVIAFGTFDYLHAGHENYLEQAKKLGDHLTVIVARDATVRKIKGSDPDNRERQRLKKIKSLPSVDKALLGSKEDKFQVIRKIKPNIIALGYDQFVFTQQLQGLLIRNNLNTEVTRLKPYKPEINKSSIIKQTHAKKQSESCREESLAQ